MRRLFLLSSSRTADSKFLEYARDDIKKHFQGIQTLTFVPYASADHEGYTQQVADFFTGLDIEVNSVHQFESPAAAIQTTEAIFIGGGNTFRLLSRLYQNSLIAPIQAAVLSRGVPYLGASAGSNVACPTIQTTNDMPIMQPPTFDALNLVPFQINPHFLDADPNSLHQGETREDRLIEYHEENSLYVAGLREGAWLKVNDTECWLGGTGAGMRAFLPSRPTRDMTDGNVSFLLG